MAPRSRVSTGTGSIDPVPVSGFDRRDVRDLVVKAG